MALEIFIAFATGLLLACALGLAWYARDRQEKAQLLLDSRVPIWSRDRYVVRARGKEKPASKSGAIVVINATIPTLTTFRAMQNSR